MTHHIHPWRRLRALGDAWRLVWRDLPEDTFGYTHFPSRTIVLAKGMSFEERRCTVLHEVRHVERGPASVCSVVAEEATVDRECARLLLPSMEQIVDALVFHHGDYEATAEELWVDAWTLEVRLSTLHGLERKYLDRRLADVILHA